MDPRIIAISGSTRGSIFRLSDNPLSIGRDPSNQVAVSEQWVSRQHCEVLKIEGAYHVRDLGSHNGTFINGVPIKDRVLEHGDRIEIPGCLFLFLLDSEDAGGSPPAVRFEDSETTGRSTVALRREDARYLRSETLVERAAVSPDISEDLRMLLRVSTAMSSQPDLPSLERELLDIVFDLVPAERGAILLVDDRTCEVEAAFARSREGGNAEPVPVSRSVVDRVLEEGVSLLSNDVPQHEDWGKAPSLAQRRVRSVLCLPLVLLDRITGALYLEASAPEARFDQRQLELLTAVGTLAGAALEKARQLERLRRQGLELVSELRVEHQLVGQSPVMHKVYALLAKVAPTEATVLIRGESGTGKELAARAIHLNSERSSGPFFKIDCTTLTESLLESELFGHEKGAFTGAVGQKKGRLEMADGGTVFLDEVGELAPALQAKLLRVLQDHEFERVGGTRPIRVDVRVVAATNRDLEAAVKSGEFREDLYYRLNVISTTLPPLRERGDDVLLLANYFLSKLAPKVKREVRGISPSAARLLEAYRWPGNVRELENAVERAVVLGSSEYLEPEDLPEALLEAPAEKGGEPLALYHQSLRTTKMELIRDAVARARGNYTEAARILGLHPNYLHRLVTNLGMREELKRLTGD